MDLVRDVDLIKGKSSQNYTNKILYKKRFDFYDVQNFFVELKIKWKYDIIY